MNLLVRVSNVNLYGRTAGGSGSSSANPSDRLLFAKYTKRLADILPRPCVLSRRNLAARASSPVHSNC